MVEQAIILAGGLGTRLRSVVEECPKSMALINEKPFLEYLLDYLISQKIQKFILSVGYKSAFIESHFGASYKGTKIVYVYEDTPLGTGGAVKKALEYVDADCTLVTNGDTLFLVDLVQFFQVHQKTKASISLALKSMKDFDRYGTVKISEEGKVVAFQEKQYQKEGFINGGMYLFNKNVFDAFVMEEKFSLEKDFFEKYLQDLALCAWVSDPYFLDIGIPEDYQKAQSEFVKFPVFGAKK